MGRNMRYAQKTWQKNRDKFELALQNQRFLKDVDEIRSFFGLPIVIPTNDKEAEKWTKALRIFFQDKLLLQAALILKITLPKRFFHTDLERIINFIHFLNSGDIVSLCNSLRKKIEPDSVYTEPKVSDGQKIPQFDLYSPDSLQLIAISEAFRLQKIAAPIISGKISGKIQLNSKFKLTADELGLIFLSSIVRWHLCAGFLRCVMRLLRNLGFGKEWFFPIILFLLTGEDIVAKGFVPPLNVFIRWYPDGGVMLEMTPSTRSRDIEAAYYVLDQLEEREKRHNYPYRNQERDLKILKFKEESQNQRKTKSQIDEEDEDAVTPQPTCTNSDEIATHIFGLDWSDPCTPRRQQNVVRQAARRVNERIQESYKKDF